MHINPKRGIGWIPKHKMRTLVQKQRNDVTRTEGSISTCYHTNLITSADYTADHQRSVQTQRHDFAKLSPPNQINNTDNSNSGQVPVAFNRAWLMVRQSKLAENETRSALYHLKNQCFHCSPTVGVDPGLFLKGPGLTTLWEHPAVFEASYSHSHWPWTVCSPSAPIVQTGKKAAFHKV